MPKENADPALIDPLPANQLSTSASAYTPFKYLKNEQQMTANPFAPKAGHASATEMTSMPTARKPFPPKNRPQDKERKRVSSAGTDKSSSMALLESFRTARAGDRRLILRRQLGVADINASLDSITLNDNTPPPQPKKNRKVKFAPTRSERFEAAGITLNITAPPPSPNLPSTEGPDLRPPFLDLSHLDEWDEWEAENDNDEPMDLGA